MARKNTRGGRDPQQQQQQKERAVREDPEGSLQLLGALLDELQSLETSSLKGLKRIDASVAQAAANHPLAKVVLTDDERKDLREFTRAKRFSIELQNVLARALKQDFSADRDTVRWDTPLSGRWKRQRKLRNELRSRALSKSGPAAPRATLAAGADRFQDLFRRLNLKGAIENRRPRDQALREAYVLLQRLVGRGRQPQAKLEWMLGWIKDKQLVTDQQLLKEIAEAGADVVVPFAVELINAMISLKRVPSLEPLSGEPPIHVLRRAKDRIGGVLYRDSPAPEDNGDI